MDKAKAKAKVRWDVGANVHYLNDIWNLRNLFGVLHIHLHSLRISFVLFTSLTLWGGALTCNPHPSEYIVHGVRGGDFVIKNRVYEKKKKFAKVRNIFDLSK